MIATLLRTDWLNLRRDYIALSLTFVMPIIFFSIFAVIFGSMNNASNGTASTKIIAVDLDQSEISRRLIAALNDQAALRVVSQPEATDDNPTPADFTREQALQRVRRGQMPAAVIIPAGFGATFGSFTGGAEPVEVIHDPADPIVLQLVSGLLQAAAMTAAPDILMERGMQQLEAAGGLMTPRQRELMRALKPILRGLGASAANSESAGGSAQPSAAMFSGLIAVSPVDAGQDPDDSDAQPRSIIAYYAAGIGVMFLLFSMANGAGGALLEEQERGTLERLLITNLSMSTLLLGRWLFFLLTGIAQVTLMFVWAAVVFGLDLWTVKHFVGFAAMTIVTAAAAAAFGIVLATACRSRAQLGGISTIVILIMSALGGSMIPRFIMPPFMNTAALYTFNGWALDGYLKVFWYEDPSASTGQAMIHLLPQIGMLVAMALVFLCAARLLARRWQAT